MGILGADRPPAHGAGRARDAGQPKDGAMVRPGATG